tara:strand:- start:290 stop:928 length:639 start_codon:yes stop_codon:yes gene_type:complete
MPLKPVPENETPKFSIQDFIGIFDDAVDPNFCDFLCNYIDQSSQVASRNYTHVKDKQICLDAFSPGEAKGLMEYINGCLYYYINEFSYLTNFSYVSALVLLQKTEPTEGYHMFHGENINWNVQNRTLAWMVYLNDVEEGGETEFLYQKLKVKPKKGTVLIWPGAFTHLHRGNPPMSDKYIGTGWYQGNIGLPQVQTAGINDRQYMDSMSSAA